MLAKPLLLEKQDDQSAATIQKIIDLERKYMYVLGRQVRLNADSLPLHERPPGEVSATDASNSGAGVCKTTGLMAEGRAFLLDAAAPRNPQSACEVVLLGPFDGISAMRVAWANLGLSCHSYISIDTAEDARRVVESEWPGVTHVKDIRSISEKTVVAWRDKSPSATWSRLLASLAKILGGPTLADKVWAARVQVCSGLCSISTR